MQRQPELTRAASDFSLRAFILPFYVPAFLSSLANGLAIPLLPLYAETIDPHGSLAGIIVGMFGFGSLAANVPAGMLSARIGDRNTMILSIATEIVGAIGAALAPSAPILALSVFLLGSAQALFFVSRLSFFRRLVPTTHRARALAILGGEFRLGSTVGPMAGGLIAGAFGYRMTFFGLGVLVLVVIVMIIRWIPKDSPASQHSNTAAPMPGAGSTSEVPGFAEMIRGAIGGFRGNGQVFATAGAAIIMLQLARAGRSVVLPLWGTSIGLGVESIGFVVGFMYMVELALFIPAGIIMDRLGRKWSGVPCLVLMALALALLPLSHSFGSYITLAILAGMGNGIGSGINMTLSTDFAPRRNPGNFIGAWRFVVDGGTTVGPFIVGAVRAVATAGLSSLVVAAFAMVGAGIMSFAVKETRTGPREAGTKTV